MADNSFNVGESWGNWERNTEESHQYADFILKELGTITGQSVSL